MTRAKLWALRQQIVLNSLYYGDYENDFDLGRKVVLHFFDGYLNYLEELMSETDPDCGSRFFELLPTYDNPENLWAWYGMFEYDPLPPSIEANTAA